MFDTNSLDRLAHATAYDVEGTKIGKVGQIYADDANDQPTFVTVSTGLFGTSESFIPLEGARMEGDDLHVGYTKDQVKDAPRIDDDGQLSPQEEQRLYEHYRLGGTDARRERTDAAAAGVAGAGHAGQEHADRDHDRSATEAVTAHEEHLNVGTRTEEAGRARLRKYTTTHTETVEVPVTKEKLVVEREDAHGTVRKGGLDEHADSDREEEIVLREERPVVEKETVERERVRVGKETVTENERVTGEVRTEHIDVDTDGRTDVDDDRRA